MHQQAQPPIFDSNPNPILNLSLNPNPTTLKQCHQNTQQQHHDSCTCILCRKQRQVMEMKKIKNKMHLQSVYQNQFVKKVKMGRDQAADGQARNKKQRRDRSQGNVMANASYIELQSTYNNDFITKRGQISKPRPLDNLGGHAASIPPSTTYMRSYHSTMTPKPDDPFKRLQMPVGTTAIPFSSQSIYQKAFNREHSLKPNLPFLQREALSKPKSLGIFQSTHQKSYSTININPQGSIGNGTIEKPKGNIVNLPSFGHNYDTTYRNCFISGAKKSETKFHNIDQIGNVYRRRNLFKF